MIARVWHGYATPENADTYERITREETLIGIAERNISGFQGIQLLRRDRADEVEFITIMWFDSIESVQSFAGADYERAVVPPKSQAILKRFDEVTQIYEVLAQVRQPA